ncbi:MAG: hypothetical protein KDD47_28790, partial [Acidobacteria bacterium]|nr:hypothetical protein [Acidobacteriota bacterium]
MQWQRGVRIEPQAAGMKVPVPVMLSFLALCASGCSGIAAVASCGSRPAIEKTAAESLRVRLVAEHLGQTLSDEVVVSCYRVGNECRGGDWYTVWKMTPPKRPSLVVRFKDHQTITAKIPSCSSLSASVGQGDQYFGAWPNPVVSSEDGDETL